MLKRHKRIPLLAEHIWWFTTTQTNHLFVRLNYSKRHNQRPTEFILLERFGGSLGLCGHIPLRWKPSN
jgi:hypothetical protein